MYMSRHKFKSNWICDSGTLFAIPTLFPPAAHVLHTFAPSISTRAHAQNYGVFRFLCTFCQGIVNCLRPVSTQLKTGGTQLLNQDAGARSLTIGTRLEEGKLTAELQAIKCSLRAGTNVVTGGAVLRTLLL